MICEFINCADLVSNTTVSYAYSTNGSATPTNWGAVSGMYLDAACTIPTTLGGLGQPFYVKVNAVPFNQDNAVNNTIWFRAYVNGYYNYTMPEAIVIQIDSFVIQSPLSWVNTQTPTVITSFAMNSGGGLLTSLVQYAYSTTGM